MKPFQKDSFADRRKTSVEAKKHLLDKLKAKSDASKDDADKPGDADKQK